MVKQRLHFILLILPFILTGQINLNNAFPEQQTIPFYKSSNYLNEATSNQYSVNEDCSQEFSAGYHEAIWIGYNWMVANDITVDSNTQMTVQKLEFEVITIEGLPTTFNIDFYYDNSGSGPASQLGESLTDITPVSITPNGTWGQAGYAIYKVVLELPNAPVLQAASTVNKKYWIGISAAPTTEGSFYIYLASSLYEQNSVSNPTWISDSSVWIQYTNAGSKAEGIIKFSGECEPLQGCTDAPNGQFPSEVFIPDCNGFSQSITPENSALTGQYSEVQVTNGKKYIFSSSEPTDFITIASEDGTTLAVGYGFVSWTANFEGKIKFYTHLDNACTSSENEYRERRVQCGIPDCDHQKVISHNFQNGSILGGIMAQDLAFDIPVTETGFHLFGIELNLIQNSINGDNITFNVNLFNEINGVPGSSLASPAVSIYEKELLGTVFFNSTNFDIYRYVLKFENSVELNADAWAQIGIAGGIGEIYWESNPNTILGSGIALRNLGTGFNWAINPASDLVYSLICEETLDVKNNDLFAFSYYPNPVNDKLIITSEKQINTIDVYTLSGQSVLNNLKLINGELNLQTLASGIYLCRVELEGRQIETFKILKK
ncbi:T9SS type A sorting domain-containing protein [Moheibacter sediminis]|uniref:Por secretion system C-terminal sorting domain-containing protein n=1 Tax=Moheibacter sediminis TaxID=1434700 RepID=A0A1W2AMK7_9FLAO|nr:T9SS type A sorting domain-containing protein [Moheibacter sediminis]SMC61770.1 Por secretion system C-terminal sorting domain-containing protein [Moheibacter sediminis]